MTYLYADMMLMCFSSKNEGNFIILARSLSLIWNNTIACALLTVDEDFA